MTQVQVPVAAGVALLAVALLSVAAAVLVAIKDVPRPARGRHRRRAE